MRERLRRMHLFFFSSRRRHTRFDCDWSSDVCSSDLGTDVRVIRRVAEGEGQILTHVVMLLWLVTLAAMLAAALAVGACSAASVIERQEIGRASCRERV